MPGCRNKDVIEAVREKAKKLGLTEEDVEEAVEWVRRGNRTRRLPIEDLQSSQSQKRKDRCSVPPRQKLTTILATARWVSGVSMVSGTRAWSVASQQRGRREIGPLRTRQCTSGSCAGSTF